MQIQSSPTTSRRPDRRFARTRARRPRASARASHPWRFAIAGVVFAPRRREARSSLNDAPRPRGRAVGRRTSARSRRRVARPSLELAPRLTTVDARRARRAGDDSIVPRWRVHARSRAALRAARRVSRHGARAKRADETLARARGLRRARGAMGRRRGRRSGVGARDGGRDVRGRRETSLGRRLRRRAARGERERAIGRIGRRGGRRLGANGAGVSTRVFQRVEGGDVRHAGERGEGDDDVERGRGCDVGRGGARGRRHAAQGGESRGRGARGEEASGGARASVRDARRRFRERDVRERAGER